MRASESFAAVHCRREKKPPKTTEHFSTNMIGGKDFVRFDWSGSFVSHIHMNIYLIYVFIFYIKKEEADHWPVVLAAALLCQNCAESSVAFILGIIFVRFENFQI